MKEKSHIKKDLIDGVKIKPLKYNIDDRGRLMEILRNDDDIFLKFGQVYITTAYPGVVKAWHAHKYQYDNITCIVGAVKLALYDDREGSPTRGWINEFYLTDLQPILIQIPPLVWHGFKNIGVSETVVLNIPTQPFNHDNPDELRLPPDGVIPYSWELINR